MDEYFAAYPLTNARTLCVGGITSSEAQAARDEGLDVDGSGYYIFLSNEDAPEKPVQLLAKCFSAVEARQLARLLSREAA
jgi:hypothetical protein